jgi:precorrin-2 dehydrogenase/sirohydrochlorin ferrochelatase
MADTKATMKPENSAKKERTPHLPGSAAPSVPVYPVMLKIANKRCVVIGGGKVAERKVSALLEAGANVLVVAEEATEGLQSLASAGKIQLIKKPFSEDCLAGAFLVIAATGSEQVNEAVVAAGRAVGALVNVVDSPQLCSFYVPASVRRGNLIISISTAGESPALAARLQDELERTYGEEYGLLSQLFGELRQEVQNTIQKEQDRRRAWQRALERSDEILNCLRSGRLQEARELMRNCLFSPSA